MEIERKFLIRQLPDNLADYPHKTIMQGYLCTDPAVRIRQLGDQYILTFKGSGLRSRIEEEMPLTKSAFTHLLKKTDGNTIFKTRYRIPDSASDRTIELDEFHEAFSGIWLAEVEFASVEQADAYLPPDWFGEEVTYDGSFHNSHMSLLSPSECAELVARSQASLQIGNENEK